MAGCFENVHVSFRPLIIGEFLSPIRDDLVIAVNEAWRVADWVDITFWGDCRWGKRAILKKEFLDHPSLKVTCCHIPENVPAGAIMLGRTKQVEPRLDFVYWSSNAGASALVLGACLARQVILLGFDMKRKGPDNNWHRYHGQSPKTSAYLTYKQDFYEIEDALQKWPWPVDVINATPKSALHAFRSVDYKDLI